MSDRDDLQAAQARIEQLEKSLAKAQDTSRQTLPKLAAWLARGSRSASIYHLPKHSKWQVSLRDSSSEIRENGEGKTMDRAIRIALEAMTGEDDDKAGDL
jgi:hypothetical protein